MVGGWGENGELGADREKKRKRRVCVKGTVAKVLWFCKARWSSRAGVLEGSGGCVDGVASGRLGACVGHKKDSRENSTRKQLGRKKR